MHPYGTDSKERMWVPLSILPFSFLLADRLGRLLNYLGLDWGGSWEFLADPTSAAFCFGGLLWLFDRWFWRCPILHWLGFVKVPDLRGTWDGYLKSSWNDFSTPYDATLSIEQTWSSIRVRQHRKGSSSSYSEAGTLLTDAGEGLRLSYEYRNDPEPGQPATMASHRGTAVLVLTNDDGQAHLRGTYYTSHGRRNTGSMQFWKGARPAHEEREHADGSASPAVSR